MEARSGTAGNPTTLERALLQFTDIEFGPPSESVAGAVNSAMTSFGS